MRGHCSRVAVVPLVHGVAGVMITPEVGAGPYSTGIVTLVFTSDGVAEVITAPEVGAQPNARGCDACRFRVGRRCRRVLETAQLDTLRSCAIVTEIGVVGATGRSP
jgi:hypothetical protein